MSTKVVIPRLQLADPPHADDRRMVGRYVHRFGSRQGFQGAIVGIWAYQDGNGTYRMALQVNMRRKQALHFA
jgi:hypothetical protein